jgi:hypothetical protein
MRDMKMAARTMAETTSATITRTGDQLISSFLIVVV